MRTQVGVQETMDVRPTMGVRFPTTTPCTGWVPVGTEEIEKSINVTGKRMMFAFRVIWMEVTILFLTFISISLVLVTHTAVFLVIREVKLKFPIWA